MDQYYIAKILGKGAEGQVLLAEHKKTHYLYAIKRLTWSSLKEANQRLNEANTLKSLNHKNIVKFYEVFLNKYSAESSYVCIVLEYCERGDLHFFIEKQKSHIQEDLVIKFMCDICEGLQYLHEKSIIHRDLKPKNIFISEEGDLKIGDFGISKELGNSHLANTKCGSPHYMSWEMLDEKSYDEKTDMYSVGVILLQLMTGKSMMISVELSKDSNLFDKLEKELSKVYSIEIVKLIRNLTSVTPKDRSSAKEVISFLKNFERKKLQEEWKSNPNKISLKSVLLTPDDIQMYILTFLDFQDLYTIIRLNKTIYSKCEKLLWKVLCENTKFGQSALKIYNEKELSYKDKIKLYYLHLNSTIQKKNRDNIGKKIISEVHPSKIDALTPLIKKYLENKAKILIDSIINTKDIQSKDYTLLWFIETFVKYGLKFGRIYTSTYYEKEKQEIKGVAIWQHPYARNKISYQKMLRTGMAYAPFYIKWKYISNFSSFLERHEKYHEKIINPKENPHWNLLFLGVDPGNFNSNIGSELLFPVLKNADESHISVYTSVYLPNENLIKFFEKSGFKVLEKVPKSKEGFPEFWCLFRKPK